MEKCHSSNKLISMNNTMKNITMTCLAGLILSTNILLAQERNEEVTIIAPYKPTIIAADKINFQPRIHDQESTMPTVQYITQSRLFETSVNPKPIEASKKPGDPKKKLLRNLIRAGFGNYTTPYFEFFANTRQSKKHAVGVHLRHISSFGEIKDYAPSSYSMSDVQIFGKKFFGENTFTGNAYFDHDLVHYYGFKPDEFPEIEYSKDDIRHRFQTFGIDAGIGSNYTSGEPLNYLIDLNYHYIQDNYQASEHRVHLGAKLDKVFKFTSITENQNFGLDLDMDYFINNDTIQDYNGGFLKLLPYISTNFNQYKFYLGIDISYRFDESSKLYVYPVARVDIKIIKDALSLYAGINGSLDRITLRSLSLENPFINATPMLKYRSNKFVFDAGFLGNIAQNLNYKVGGSYGMIDNMPFYVNDTTNGLMNMFTLVYDNVNILNLNAELGFKRNKVMHLWLGGDYFQYYMDKEEKPWHKPDFRVKIGGDYIIQERFIVKAELFMQGSMHAKLYESDQVVAQKIDGWADLNLGFEYRVTDKLSAFINLNNVLNNGYLKWHNYPVQKFNALVGVSFAF